MFGPPRSGSVIIFIRILPSTNKNSKNTLISTILWLLFGFLFMKTVKTDVNVPSKSNKQKKLLKTFFVDILSATDEKSKIRIRSRIRIRKSVERIRGSGSVPKYHGSTTPKSPTKTPRSDSFYNCIKKNTRPSYHIYCFLCDADIVCFSQKKEHLGQNPLTPPPPPT